MLDLRFLHNQNGPSLSVNQQLCRLIHTETFHFVQFLYRRLRFHDQSFDALATEGTFKRGRNGGETESQLI